MAEPSHAEIILSPKPPDVGEMDLPEPTIRSLEDFGEAVGTWAEESNVMDQVDGAKIRIVSQDLERLVEEPIPHGNYKGQRRFVSPAVAELLSQKTGQFVPPNPLPTEQPSWLDVAVDRRYARLAYTQGSSEFASIQQQGQLLREGHIPPILEHYIRWVNQEELEHGAQMAGWLLNNMPVELGGLLAEDLLARRANDPDREVQQPLIEFNPTVRTLPEVAHYFDKQDRDGWSQLMSTRMSADAAYAGMMLFFLRQESRHMGAGEAIIKWYLQAGKIPMDLHLKMEWEWSAIAYRLHGNPLNSGGAERLYAIGAKGAIFPFDNNPFFKIREGKGGSTPGYFVIPDPNADEGFRQISLEEMSIGHLNGYTMSTLRAVIQKNNRKRSALLTEKQRAEMRSYLEKVTQYVPDDAREEILESGIIPTAAISWRPEHLAVMDSDPWTHIKGYYTDVFGYRIPTFEEYKEYRRLVSLTPEDRDLIRDITSAPGWMVEDVKPGDKPGDIYRSGPVAIREEDDTLFHQFTVGQPRRRMTLFTMPRRVRDYRAEKASQEPETATTPVEGIDGGDWLREMHGDLVGGNGA